MEELEISGKRYISSKVAGKAYKYHPDYIGQLIRGNKVNGEKIGRAWYVDADDLVKYLNGEKSRIENIAVKHTNVVWPSFIEARSIVQKESPAVLLENIKGTQKEEIPLKENVSRLEEKPEVIAVRVIESAKINEGDEEVSSLNKDIQGEKKKIEGELRYVDDVVFFPKIEKQNSRDSIILKPISAKISTKNYSAISPIKHRKKVNYFFALALVAIFSLFAMLIGLTFGVGVMNTLIVSNQPGSQMSTSEYFDPLAIFNLTSLNNSVK